MRKTILTLILCLSSLTHVNAGQYVEKFELKGFGTIDTDRAHNLLISKWIEWERLYGNQKLPKLKVTVVSDLQSQLGVTQNHEIKISRNILSHDFDSVLAHELAHVFIQERFSHCHELSVVSQEVLAQYLSQDYERISKAKETPKTLQQALVNLESQATQRQTELSISRLLVKENIRNNLLHIMRDKTDCDRLNNRIKMALWDKSLPPVTNDVDYLIMDIKSGRVIESKGDILRKSYTGSSLKPLLVAQYPSLTKTNLSDLNSSWKCSVSSNIWTWKMALTHSCNEYFLDALKTEKLGEDSAEELIGLRPKIKKSLLEMAYLYRDMNQNSRWVLDGLKDVVKMGTLHALPDSIKSFFYTNNILVKTGTVRNAHNQPEDVWLVGVNVDNYIIVAKSYGRSTHSLATFVAKNIRLPIHVQFEPASVQILSRVPMFSLRWSCDEEIKKNWFEFKGRNIIKCPRGPVFVRVESAKKTSYINEYWGEIELIGRGEVKNLELNKNRARIQSGSSVLFRTSRLEYLLGVLYSESASVHSAAKQSVAIIANHNLSSKRHLGRAICDSTHCQVFSPKKYSDSWLNEVVESIKSIDFKKYRFAEDWLEFSLGGTEAWKKNILSNRINILLGLPFLDQMNIIKTRGGWTISGKYFDCEKLRSELKLYSCPTQITQSGDRVEFQGFGEGHGKGLDLLKAESMAKSGFTHDKIIQKFYSRSLLN